MAIIKKNSHHVNKLDYGEMRRERADNGRKELNGICSIHFTFITATSMGSIKPFFTALLK